MYLASQCRNAYAVWCALSPLSRPMALYNIETKMKLMFSMKQNTHIRLMVTITLSLFLCHYFCYLICGDTSNGLVCYWKQKELIVNLSKQWINIKLLGILLSKGENALDFHVKYHVYDSKMHWTKVINHKTKRPQTLSPFLLLLTLIFNIWWVLQYMLLSDMFWSR